MKTETFFGCLPETISPVLFPWLNPNFILLTFPPLHRPFNFSSVPLLSRIHSLRPYGLQHARLPCPSPTPSACSNSCPSSWWCHPTISPSVIPFSSCLQSFSASGFFLRSQFFISGGKILAFQLQHQSFQWIFRTDFFWNGLVWSPCSPGTLKSLLQLFEYS